MDGAVSLEALPVPCGYQPLSPQSNGQPFCVSFVPQQFVAPDDIAPRRPSELPCSTCGAGRLPSRQRTPLLSFRRGLGNFALRCGVRRPAHPINHHAPAIACRTEAVTGVLFMLLSK